MTREEIKDVLSDVLFELGWSVFDTNALLDGDSKMQFECDDLIKIAEHFYNFPKKQETMIDKELIKKEIKRRINLLKNGEADLEVMKRVEGVLLAYNSILEFIDSIPEESGCEVNCTTRNEDLEEELHSWMRENCDDNGFFNQLELARHFAEWGRNHFEYKIGMVSEDLMKESNGSPREGLWNAKKVTEWLENHIKDYKHYDSDFRDGNIDVDNLVEDLRKAMED